MLAPPGVADDSWHEPPLGGRLWVVGARELMQDQLSFLLREQSVEPRFVDAAPDESSWGDASAGPQTVLIDVWRSHGRCVDALPGLLETARRRNRRMLIISAVAQDSAVGTIDQVWPLFRPLRRLALREALVWAFDTAPPRAAAAPPEREHFHNRPRVLLVDDNVVNQLLGKAMLDALGAEVVVADGGQAAIELAASRTFDLVLMDLQMPGIDGLEATRCIRRAEQAADAPRTPVVALTGQTLPALQAQCQHAGMDDVLTKPYTLDQLRELLQATVWRV